MTTGNGSLDRLIKIGSIIVTITMAYATLQAQVFNKLESTRFVVDSVNKANRLGTVEQVLLQDLQRSANNQRAICRKLSIECQ